MSSLTILTASDVDKVLSTLSVPAAVDSQAAIFRAFSSTSHHESPLPVQTPLRITLSSPDTTSLFMPSRVAAAGGMACKIVSVPSAGGEGGLPASTIVLDERTGKVRAMINARRLTAVRNAAGSALFLQTIPPATPPKHLVIFGSGAQALSHAEFILRNYESIERCTVVLRKQTNRAAELLRTLRSSFPDRDIDLGVTGSPAFDLAATVRSATIIVCVTSSTQPLFDSKDVSPGTHFILIGSYKPTMHEVDCGLIRRAGKVVVDSMEACLSEAGELISAGVGEDGVVELGEILHDGGLADPVKKGGDVVIYKSVGIGIQDVAIANLVLEQAEDQGLGTVIDHYD